MPDKYQVKITTKEKLGRTLVVVETRNITENGTWKEHRVFDTLSFGYYGAMCFDVNAAMEKATAYVDKLTKTGQFVIA